MYHLLERNLQKALGFVTIPVESIAVINILILRNMLVRSQVQVIDFSSWF